MWSTYGLIFCYFFSCIFNFIEYNFLVNVKSIDEVKITEHDEYKWLSIEEVRKNTKITDEVKFTLEMYNYNFNRNNK